jgi:hypothetical protein
LAIRPLQLDEGRKRVLLIAASILAARKLANSMLEREFPDGQRNRGYRAMG